MLCAAVVANLGLPDHKAGGALVWEGDRFAPRHAGAPLVSSAWTLWTASSPGLGTICHVARLFSSGTTRTDRTISA